MALSIALVRYVSNQYQKFLYTVNSLDSRGVQVNFKENGYIMMNVIKLITKSKTSSEF